MLPSITPGDVGLGDLSDPVSSVKHALNFKGSGCCQVRRLDVFPSNPSKF